jgi:two-component system, OmpR family, response regulator
MRNTPSVLIADDDRDNAQSLAELLTLLGFEARAASTALDAVRLAAAHPPDAVVMDLSWPGPDGCDLAGAVCRAAGRRPLLVALTGCTGQEGRTRAAGFDHHLLKPADPMALANLLTATGGRRPSPNHIVTA